MTNRTLLLAIIGAARGLKKEEAGRVIETLLNEHDFDASRSLADAALAARSKPHPFVKRISDDRQGCSRCGLGSTCSVHQPEPFNAEELAEFKAKDRTRKMSRFVLDVARILEESPLAEAARVIKGRLEDSGLVEKPEVKVVKTAGSQCGQAFMSVTGQAWCTLLTGHVYGCVSRLGEREKAEGEGVCIEPIKLHLVSDDNPPDASCILNKGHDGPHVSCWGTHGAE